MKILALLLTLFFASQIQAQSACKCNCDKVSATLCASWYDIDHPCLSRCPNSGAPPMGRTACPVKQVFNPDKGIMEWQTLCPDNQ